MKKIMSVFAIVFSVMFALSSESVAQVVPQEVKNPLWMFTSEKAMASYLLSQAKMASAYLYSEGAVVDEGAYPKNSFWVQGTNGLDLRNKLLGRPLEIRVLNPTNDTVGLGVFFYGENFPRPLFYGYSYGKMVKDGPDGKWRIDGSLFDINIQFPSVCQVKIPNARSAKILVRNIGGNIIETKYLDVSYEGVVSIESRYLGSSGDIVVQVFDETVPCHRALVGSLSEKDPVEPTVGGGMLSIDFDGVQEYDENAGWVGEWSDDGHLLRRVIYTKEKNVILYANSNSGKKPVRVYIRKVNGDADPVYLPWTDGAVSIEWKATPGEYDIWFDWGEIQYVQPDYYGEKG